MFRLLLVLVTLKLGFGAAEVFPKCCDSDSVLQKGDSSYNCTEDLNRRTQIIAERDSFIESSEEGFCVDVEDSLSLFWLNGTDLTKVKDLSVDFYPKCCPLDYFYNSTTHGCVKSPSKLKTFFSDKFVKVGLPNCKIIEDLNLKTDKDLERLNGSLYAQKKIYNPGRYCVDKDQDNLFVVRICHNNYDICDSIRCVRKCCPDGQSFINGSKCHNTFVHGMDFSTFAGKMDNINDSFAIVHDGFTPPLYPLLPRFQYHLDASGIFTMTEIDESLGRINVTRHYRVYEKVYCVEHVLKKSLNNVFFFRGFPPQTQIKFLYTRIAMVISCIFLALTILYYCISSEKRTLFGKTLISYCSASFVLFLQLSYFAFNDIRPEPGAKTCIVFAFVLVYSTLAIFTWMNIMCIDIYWTFGSSKSFSSRHNRSKEMKRFMLYSLYGWGSPLVLTAIPLIFYHVDVLPFALQVILNEQKCFLYRGDGNYAQFLFLTIPLSILQICDLVLFVKTVMYCLKVKREINKMNDTHVLKGEKSQAFNKYRDRIGLLSKLFLIMGVSFLFEVVSTFCDFKKEETMAVIEIIWDTFNSLQGLFIFLIFLAKKRILKKCKGRVGLKKLRKFSLVSSAMTQTTSLPTINNKQ